MNKNHDKVYREQKIKNKTLNHVPSVECTVTAILTIHCSDVEDPAALWSCCPQVGPETTCVRIYGFK